MGDQHCRVNLNIAAHIASGTILSTSDDRIITLSGIGTFDEDWFSGGLATITSGANKICALKSSAIPQRVQMGLWNYGARHQNRWQLATQSKLALVVTSNFPPAKKNFPIQLIFVVSLTCQEMMLPPDTSPRAKKSWMGDLFMAIDNQIVAAAKNWIGTPYMHAASMQGVGCDCLGLVRGVWRDIYGLEPEIPPPYAPDWIDVSKRESLKDAAQRHMAEIDPKKAGLGNLVLFRIEYSSVAKHAAILSGQDKMIHAYSRHAVVESTMGPWWHRRLAYAFLFPQKSENN